jgi:hypothetical protein
LVEIIEILLQVVSEISTSRLSCAITNIFFYRKALVRTNSIIPLWTWRFPTTGARSRVLRSEIFVDWPRTLAGVPWRQRHG